MRYQQWFAVLLLAIVSAPARTEVVDSSATGFTVKLPLHIQAPPADVYRKFVRNVADWWDSSHTFSGSAKNMSIEEKAMGCFCEKLADGGAVRHLEIISFAPGKSIVFSGALGPMQALAATGTLTLRFSAEEGGTKLDVTYAASGYLPAGMNRFAVPSDGMLSGQFARFKNYVEKGSPDGK
jgi:uncharacterized protein YndB with AHSA1/START domain